MAIQYHFDLYPRTDPKNGARLVRFTKLQSAEYRAEANGTGAGRFSIRGDTTDASFIDPAGLQYIRVVREDTVAVTEAVVGGFFLDNGDFTALDDKGTRLLVFGGAGTLSYLARAVMAPHTYISPIFTGQDPFDDIWRLYAQSTVYANGNYLGAMLWRVIYEAQHFTPGSHKHVDGIIVTDTHADDRTVNALPALTIGFTQFVDSSAATWTASSGEFKAQIGENVLGIVKRLMEAGLYVSMDPDTFELDAWQAAAHGRTRTGASWGASVIRFQAPSAGMVDTGNIKSDAKRGIAAFVKRSLLWSGGSDVYAKSTTGGSDIPWEGFYPSDASDATALGAIAAVQLGARSDAGDTLRLRMKLDASPTTGKYLPFESAGVLLDDTVTVHTGTGQWDYNEDTFPVAALTVQLRQGGDWDAWADLGSSYTSMAERAFQARGVGTHSHPPNPQLCLAGVIAAPTVIYDRTWDEAAYDANSYAITSAEGVSHGGSRFINIGSSSAGGFPSAAPWGIAETIPVDSADVVDVYLEAAKLLTGGGGDACGIEFRDSGGTVLATHPLKTGAWTAGAWYPLEGQFTAPANTTYMTVYYTAILDAWFLDRLSVTMGGGTSTINDGHPDLIRTGTRAKRCGDTEHYFADREPTVNDDFATMGMRYGTHWVYVDDLDNPTESFGSWMLVDTTEGAAVWVEVSSGASTDIHIADTSDAHNASAISALDAGGYFTGTDVEAQLQEIGAGGAVATHLRRLTHGAFLMAAHKDSDRKPYLFNSIDGITFDSQLGASPLFSPNTSDGKASDPSITHWDGKWWLAHTGTTSGSKFTVLSSPDLIAWTEIHEVDVSAIVGANGVWAPEWFIDPSTGDVHIFLAVSTVGVSDFQIREVHPTNRAMTTWSSPVTVTGTSLPANIIDPFMVYAPELGTAGKPYKLWFKDEADKMIEYAESAALTSGFTLVETGDWAGWNAAKDAGANSIEGMSLVRLDDGRWRIYFNENNGLTSIRTVYSESVDDWATWTTQASLTTDFLLGHPTVVRIPGTTDHERADDPHLGYLNEARHGDIDHSGLSLKRWAPMTTDPINTGAWVLLFSDNGDVYMSEVEG